MLIAGSQFQSREAVRCNISSSFLSSVNHEAKFNADVVDDRETVIQDIGSFS